MVLQTENRYYTPAEYLELEEQSEFKNEYRNGEIIPMTSSVSVFSLAPCPLLPCFF
ncbi:hypothetical protein BDGGKGIB_01695 [Nodularia sphaerocarpa UHCC 0038]|nr:hypothetical protein BDGGKGIB_01695 [Nodularia sphaerocarpa UHCC 0038]